ncbi:ORF6N domain-containing protein [Mucilaginibacter ginkgonis]|uniref:ORF6N domain-containing protein n=1 Tax=Mucilaginibacter ginkgonis TaxID=2682091 RepID=A0A6I4HWI5_9SPHI|nr:ORF6N domain-containing protein [Mucilaginibacter ginkgonis]QQL51197.1 ORF6N domain-containing protein [Mucilaginibacter ginkgonis]
MKNDFIIPDDIISSKIFYIRKQKVMLDFDLAELYKVETKQLKRQVRRNLERFPGEDFMFELTPEEYNISRSQFGTLKQGQNIKYAPMAFTELGISMLSSVLNSSDAIQINIRIMRIFVNVRQLLSDTTEIRLEIEKIRNELFNQGKNMEIVFAYLDELSSKIADHSTLEVNRKRIGFKP